MTSHQPSKAARKEASFSINSRIQAFAVITGKASEYSLEVDQICGTEREARKEVKDLKAMGFDDARFKPFATWAEAEEYQDTARGY